MTSESELGDWKWEYDAPQFVDFERISSGFDDSVDDENYFSEL